MSYNIPFINPTFPPGAEVLVDYEKIHDNNYFTNNGDFYYGFKNSVEKYIGNDTHVSIVANATLGIIMTLAITMRKQKKYVLVPSFTFAAGPLAILWAGFEPLFIDVEASTLQPSINQSRELLETELENVAGILLCNTFGIGNPNIDQWEGLAREFNVPLVIDSAAGFGSTYQDNEHLGSRGLCEIFSLHATKPFGIGEGGIVSSQNEEFIDQLESLKNFGFNARREVQSLGLNAKISELSCALGSRVLPGLDERIQARQKVYRQYQDQTRDYSITFIDNADSSSLCFASLILPREWSKAALLESYCRADIEVRDYYNPAVHLQQHFIKYRQCDLKTTNDMTSRMISLPVSEKLTNQEIDRILKVIHRYAGN